MDFLAKLIPVQYRLLAGALVVLILAGGAIVAFNVLQAQADTRGYRRATLEWTGKYQALVHGIDLERDAEVARQNMESRKIEAGAAAELETYRLKLDAANSQLIQLADEAAKDPGHDNIALDAAAVARHIRRNQ